MELESILLSGILEPCRIRQILSMEDRKVFSLSCILSFAVLARSSPSIPVSDQSQTSGTRHLVRESADNHRAHGDLALIGGGITEYD